MLDEPSFSNGAGFLLITPGAHLATAVTGACLW